MSILDAVYHVRIDAIRIHIAYCIWISPLYLPATTKAALYQFNIPLRIHLEPNFLIHVTSDRHSVGPAMFLFISPDALDILI